MRAMQLALSKREKVERMLSALEELKGEGTITSERYETLMREYMDYRVKAAEELDLVRQGVERQLVQQKTRLESCAVELRELELRIRAGAVEPSQQARARGRIESKQFHLRTEIAQMEKSLRAESSAEVGGYVDAALDSAVASRFSVERFAARAAGTDLGRYFGLVGSSAELVQPGFRLVVPIASLLMFISLFLRWMAVGGFGIAAAGTSSGGTLATGILTVLFSVAAWLLVHPSIRGGVQVLMGGISVLVATLVWVPDAVGNRYYGVGLREGFFLFIVAAIAIVLAGISALRER